ncbi:hypothetical protein [Paenibacillus kobensis]|uniref:hypothetical protein n=1 Tax=Paenibacillus kobensis TaxID=59841 RepID=UPI000FD983B2|nr:hypothetical protein [Paenibacillus kobensis]
MLFVAVCTFIVMGSVYALRRAGVTHPYSKGVVLAIFLSTAALVCLAQNYTQNLISVSNDGVGITNWVANWIIGEDGRSIDKFRGVFEKSIFFTLVVILLYPLVLAAELRFAKKAQPPFQPVE